MAGLLPQGCAADACHPGQEAKPVRLANLDRLDGAVQPGGGQHLAGLLVQVSPHDASYNFV